MTRHLAILKRVITTTTRRPRVHSRWGRGRRAYPGSSDTNPHGVPIIPWGRHWTIRSRPRPDTSNLTPMGGCRDAWMSSDHSDPASLSAYEPVVSYPRFTLSQGIQQNTRSTGARLSRLPVPPCSMIGLFAKLREEAALGQLRPTTDLRVRRAAVTLTRASVNFFTLTFRAH